MAAYDTLGVDKKATTETIKKAFRRKARKHHPDRGGNKEKFVEVNKAYQLLVCPEKRKHYDETGENPDEKPNAQNTALQEFIGLFDEILNKHINDAELAYTNIISMMKEILNNVLMKNTEAIKGQRKIVQKLEALLGRITTKDEINFLDRQIEDKIKGGNRMIAEVEKRNETVRQVLELCDHYKDHPITSVMTTTNTATFSYTTYFG